MSVYKRDDGETYSFDFQFRGRRFSGNTEATNRKDAEAAERSIKAKAKLDMDEEKRTGNGPLLLRFAAGRYWEEVGKHHRASKGTWHAIELLIKFFGPDKRLDAITDADVSALVAWRRAHTVKNRGKKPLSNATVNRSVVEPLRKLFIRASRVWRYSFPREPVWREHRLKEPPERVRELHDNEAQAFDAALRPDYDPWYRFALATGLRLAETLIRWENVNWGAKTISTIGKRGLTVTTPVTPEVQAILTPLIGHDPVSVFTYVCQRPRQGQRKGIRYPLTYMGVKSEWQAMRKRAGVKSFRLHDLRHDMATKLLRETGNLKLVQTALNHRDIKTTSRYAHVLDSEVAAGLQRVAKARKKSHEKSHAKTPKIS